MSSQIPLKDHQGAWRCQGGIKTRSCWDGTTTSISTDVTGGAKFQRKDNHGPTTVSFKYFSVLQIPHYSYTFRALKNAQAKMKAQQQAQAEVSQITSTSYA